MVVVGCWCALVGFVWCVVSGLVVLGLWFVFVGFGVWGWLRVWGWWFGVGGLVVCLAEAVLLRVGWVGCLVFGGGWPLAVFGASPILVSRRSDLGVLCTSTLPLVVPLDASEGDSGILPFVMGAGLMGAAAVFSQRAFV